MMLPLAQKICSSFDGKGNQNEINTLHLIFSKFIFIVAFSDVISSDGKLINIEVKQNPFLNLIPSDWVIIDRNHFS